MLEWRTTCARWEYTTLPNIADVRGLCLLVTTKKFESGRNTRILYAVRDANSQYFFLIISPEKNQATLSLLSSVDSSSPTFQSFLYELTLCRYGTCDKREQSRWRPADLAETVDHSSYLPSMVTSGGGR
jgi:hypothetical protein